MAEVKPKKKRKWGTACAYKGCGYKFYSQSESPRRRFFRFPQEKALSDIWIHNSGRNELLGKDPKQLFNNYRLCSIHFGDEMYYSHEKHALLPSAIPKKYACATQTCINPVDETDSERQQASTALPDDASAPLFRLPKIEDVRTEAEWDTSTSATKEEQTWSSSPHDDDNMNLFEDQIKYENEIYEISDDDGEPLDDVKDPLEISDESVEQLQNGATVLTQEEDANLQVIGQRIEALKAHIAKAKDRVLCLKVLADEFKNGAVADDSAVMS